MWTTQSRRHGQSPRRARRNSAAAMAFLLQNYRRRIHMPPTRDCTRPPHWRQWGMPPPFACTRPAANERIIPGGGTSQQQEARHMHSATNHPQMRRPRVLRCTRRRVTTTSTAATIAIRWWTEHRYETQNGRRARVGLGRPQIAWTAN
ncbi:hypothetical protein SB85_09245 [Xanthomonas sacchari]|nr:hypothetical protein SB85_09245 [Xanthomonas sacchari]